MTISYNFKSKVVNDLNLKNYNIIYVKDPYEIKELSTKEIKDYDFIINKILQLKYWTNNIARKYVNY